MFQFCKEFGMCDLELELEASAMEWKLLLNEKWMVIQQQQKNNILGTYNNFNINAMSGGRHLNVRFFWSYLKSAIHKVERVSSQLVHFKCFGCGI